MTTNIATDTVCITTLQHLHMTGVGMDKQQCCQQHELLMSEKFLNYLSDLQKMWILSTDFHRRSQYKNSRKYIQ